MCIVYCDDGYIDLDATIEKCREISEAQADEGTSSKPAERELGEISHD